MRNAESVDATDGELQPPRPALRLQRWWVTIEP
jgi:hypothetical protein